MVRVLLLLVTALSSCSSQSVTTSRGTVNGVAETTPVAYYRYNGIPYANVTAKFKAPTPLEKWNTTINATQEGYLCPQLVDSSEPDAKFTQSEHCLYLNIYTRVQPSQNASLPVLVYIHGGNFAVGSGNRGWCGPEFFMLEGDVVLVTFNYRLGAFGFLSTGTKDAQGNAGMKDQVEALKWINKEIHAFGGDPTKITIFGQGAGAASVIHHVLSPMSKGLFTRAIAESGTALADWANMDTKTASQRAIRLGKNVGCDTSNMTIMVGCLSRISEAELLKASNNILTEQESIQAFSVFSPVIETKFDEEVFIDTNPEVRTYDINATVPLIIGTNRDEGVSFFSGNNNSYTVIDRNLPNFFPRILTAQESTNQMKSYAQKLRDKYFGGKTVNDTMVKDIVNLITDQLFMYPTVETVRRLARKENSSVYLYHFAYTGGYRLPYAIEQKLGYQAVAHSEELGYLLHSTVLNQAMTSQSTNDYKTMQKLVKLWKSFAANGSPVNTTDAVIKDIQWTKITNSSDLTYLEMTTNFSQAQNYYQDRINFWDGIIHRKSSSLTNQPTVLLLLTLMVFKMF